MIDTVILGGGLAGTAAALWLADQGRRALIVEARSRLGGRAMSRAWGDAGVVEYGGGWIRADHALMQDLTRRLDVGLTPRAPLVGYSYFRDGRAHETPAGDMAGYAAALTAFRADAALIATDSPEARLLQGLTLQAYFKHRNTPASLRREILAWWSISGSAASGSVAVNELLTPKLAKGFGTKLAELAFSVAGGVSTVAERAVERSGAEVILGDPSQRVREDTDGVTVTLSSGRILRARSALIALPLNCLTQIRFDPPLSPPQERLRRTGHRGQARKLLIRARGPRPGSLATGLTAGLRWIYADRDLPDGSTLLIGFGIQTTPEDPTRDQVSRALTAAFPGADLIDFDWHDWCADPFARGTWVSPDIRSLPDYDPRHWAPRGRLAFAGSDLYSAEQGWFEGALLTARAAATALHDRLQKD